MAKMFYSLEEAAKRLGRSADEVRQMAERNEITEFRDGDKLIFKKDQIDLLAGDDEASDMSSMIPLADSAAGVQGISLADSRTDRGDPAGRTGVSVFDAEELEAADPSAQTQVTSTGPEGITVESFGSGSGLMDMTKQSDDTSLGAENLLEEIYSGEGQAAVGGAAAGGGLFEGAGDAGFAPAGAAVGSGLVMAETYDGAGSGLAGGASIGAIAALAMAMMVVLMAMTGVIPSFVGSFEPTIWAAIFAGVVLVGAGLGFFIGKKM